MIIEHGREMTESSREHKNAELFRLIRTDAKIRATFDANVMDQLTRKRTKPIITVTADSEKAARATARMKLRAMYDPDAYKITRLKVRELEFLLD